MSRGFLRFEAAEGGRCGRLIRTAANFFLILATNHLAGIIGDAYTTAPLFLGFVADRFFASEKVMGSLLLIGGGLMLLVPGAVAAENGRLVFYLLLGHMLSFTFTLGLGNTLVFSNLPREAFPKVWVWGALGWIVAGPVAVCSLVLGGYCFLEQLGKIEQLGKMFSVSLPEPVDPALVSQAAQLWQGYCMLPALMAAGIAVLFFATFWDRRRETSAGAEANEETLP